MNCRDRAVLVVIYIVVVCTFFSAVVPRFCVKELAMSCPVLDPEKVEVSQFAVQDEKDSAIPKVLIFGLGECVRHRGVSWSIRVHNPGGASGNWPSLIQLRLLAVLDYFYEKLGLKGLGGSFPRVDSMYRNSESGGRYWKRVNIDSYPWAFVRPHASILVGGNPAQCSRENAVDRNENHIYKGHLLDGSPITPKFMVCVCLVPWCAHKSLRPGGNFVWLVLAFLSAHVGAYLLGFYTLFRSAARL